MLRAMQKIRTGWSRSRRLRLEPLETRLCLSTYTTVDLIPLSGHDYSIALGINDNGLAVGRSMALASDEKAAVVWSVNEAGAATAYSLPGIGDEPSMRAMEVNNDGVIAGEVFIAPENPDGKSYLHATVWIGSPEDYVAHDLGTLGGDFAWSEARSISEPDADGNVWVVGTSTDASADPQVYRGMLWQVDPAGNVLSMTDLEPTSDNVDANDVRVIGSSVFIAGNFYQDGPIAQTCIWEADLSGSICA
jgi:uncharacterized membrane protein